MAPEHMNREDLAQLPSDRLVDLFLNLKEQYEMAVAKEQAAREIIAKYEKLDAVRENMFMKRLLWDFITLLDGNVVHIEDRSGQVQDHGPLITKSIAFLCEGAVGDDQPPIPRRTRSQEFLGRLQEALDKLQPGQSTVVHYDGPGGMLPKPKAEKKED